MSDDAARPDEAPPVPYDPLAGTLPETDAEPEEELAPLDVADRLAERLVTVQIILIGLRSQLTAAERELRFILDELGAPTGYHRVPAAHPSGVPPAVEALQDTLRRLRPTAEEKRAHDRANVFGRRKTDAE